MENPKPRHKNLDQLKREIIDRARRLQSLNSSQLILRNACESSLEHIVFEFYSDPSFCYVQSLGSFKNIENQINISPTVSGGGNIQLGISCFNIQPSLDNYYWYKRISGSKSQDITYALEQDIDKNCILSFRIVAMGCQQGSSLSIVLNNVCRTFELNQDHPSSSINKYFEVDLFYTASPDSSPTVSVQLSHTECCFISLHNYVYVLPSDFNNYGFLDDRFSGWPYLSGHLRPLYCDEFKEILPTISVVVPTFNQGNTIRDTLSSLYSQNYPKLQVILLDGNSDDSTREILQDFLNFISEFRSWADSGQSSAIAEGIDIAKGEIITWLNTDDLYAPLSLFKVAIAYINGSNPDIIAGNCYVFRDEHIKWIHSSQIWHDQINPVEILDVKNYWLRGKYFHQPEIFFTRSAIRKVQEICDKVFINKSLYYSMDYDIWAKMAISSCKIKKINSVTAIYRITDEQKTSAVDNYLPELLTHSRFLANKYRFDLTHSEDICAHSISDWSEFKVLLFNDVGFFGGAGIAHKRIAASLRLYNLDVKCISVADVWSDDKYPVDLNLLDSILQEFRPNLIICGNLHGIKHSHLQILDLLSKFCACWFVAHDFWITNGELPYPSLAWENPLDSSAISQTSWINKINAISNLSLLPNSRYCREILDSCGFSRIIDSDFHLSLDSIKVDSECSQLSLMNSRSRCKKVCVVVGAVALSEERKGISVFLDALKLMPSVILSQVSIVTYGLTSLDIVSSFCEYRHCGFIDQDELSKILLEADVFVNTSKLETFGQTTLEALNFGLICLSNRNGGSFEIIEDQINGYSFDMTPQSLSNKLVDVVTFIVNEESPLYCKNKLSRSLSAMKFSAASQGYSLLQAIANSGEFSYPVGGQKVNTNSIQDIDLPIRTLL